MQDKNRSYCNESLSLRSFRFFDIFSGCQNQEDNHHYKRSCSFLENKLNHLKNFHYDKIYIEKKISRFSF